MPLTPEDVSNKRFTPVRLREGYDMGEVDQFLDEVEAELERLLKENDDLRSKLTAAADGAPVTLPAPVEKPVEKPVEDEKPAEKPAEEKPEPPQEVIKVTTAAEASSAATRLLELATRNADEVVAEAREDAEKIVTEARAAALKLETETKESTDKLEQEARARAQSLDSETETRRRDMLGDLEREKRRLDTEVEDLRGFEREYRSRLKSYFSEQLQALDGNGDGGDLPVPGDQPSDEGQHAEQGEGDQHQG